MTQADGLEVVVNWSPLITAVCVASVALLLSKAWDFYRPHWLLRHLPAVQQDVKSEFGKGHMHRAFTRWANELGPVYRFRIMHIPFIGITDPKLATEIMWSTDKLDKNVPALSLVDLMTSPHGRYPSVLTRHTDDETFKAVRKGIAPAFAPMHIKQGFGHILDASMRLVHFLQKRGPAVVVDMDRAVSSLSMDVIGHVGFGKDMGALTALEHGGHDILQIAADGLAEIDAEFRDRLPIKRFYKDVRKGRRALAAYQKAITELRQEIQARKGELAPHTIAAHLLAVQQPGTDEPLSEGQLQSEIALLFLAGFETTGHSSAWLLFLVSQHPEVQEKIIEELRGLDLVATASSPQPRPPTWADLGKMHYLQCVIKESMRMFPVIGTGTTRVNPKQDVTLGNGKLLVPKGTIVWIGQHALMNTKMNWEQPDEFRPERWTTPGTEYADGVDAEAGAGEDTSNPMLTSHRPKRYWPFSEGPRNCVGQTLGKTSMQVALVQLFAHFRFTLADEMGGYEGVLDSERVSSTTVPSKGIKMHATPHSDHIK